MKATRADLSAANHPRLHASYDLLCIEGLARALRIFLSLESPPAYALSSPPAGLLEVNVAASVNPIRPYFAAAILRLKEPLTEAAYKSFLDLQDKLHANLCRNRKFVAIGTHDLDTITTPFRYVDHASLLVLRRCARLRHCVLGLQTTEGLHSHLQAPDDPPSLASSYLPAARALALAQVRGPPAQGHQVCPAEQGHGAHGRGAHDHLRGPFSSGVAVSHWEEVGSASRQRARDAPILTPPPALPQLQLPMD
jgi:hypothetical protein